MWGGRHTPAISQLSNPHIIIQISGDRMHTKLKILEGEDVKCARVLLNGAEKCPEEAEELGEKTGSQEGQTERRKAEEEAEKGSTAR